MTEQWQELKETITELRDNDGTGTQQEVSKFLLNLMDVLEKKMSSSEKPNRWTPVSEELPKANGRYYVTRGLNACGALWNRVYIVNYSDLMGLKSERIWWDGNVGKSDFERIDDVIAWMPLPEPYKGEES